MDLLQSCGHYWVFQICWHIESSTFTASSFRIWNSSTGIPSPPLALFVVMLSKAHLTSHSRMSGSWNVSDHTVVIILVMKIFFVQFFCVFLPPLLNNFCFCSVQFSSVAQSCLTLCDPMNHSTPGLPVHHQLPEFTQIHIPRVSDAIQPSHPLLSPSPPAPNPSQHQSLFQWVNSSHEVAKVLEFQLYMYTHI